MRYIFSMVLSLTLTVALGLYTAGPTTAQTASANAKHEPPDGAMYAGVVADQQPGDTVETSKKKWDDWTRLMEGKPASISHTFEGFDTWFGFDFDIAKARGAAPLITWQTGSTSPKTIAQAGDTGSGKPADQIIVQNAKLSADYGKPAFVRIDQEMNAYWFPWSAYNKDGTQRSSSASDFQDMWRRITVIFEGGKVKDINARLASLGLPPLDPDASFPGWMGIPSVSNPESYLEPAENVAFVFNPVDAPGIPDVSGNRWLDYYPGDEYVDWVGQTTYNGTWNATMEQRFKWLDAFYQEFSVKRGKPYMMGEWGLEPKANGGFGDNPAYIDEIFKWTKAHKKVKALVYFSVNDSKGDYRLSSYPNSAKTFSNGIQQSGSLNGLSLYAVKPPWSTTESPPTPAPTPPPNTATPPSYTVSPAPTRSVKKKAKVKKRGKAKRRIGRSRR